MLTAIDIDRIIEMAWEDRTPFDVIKNQFDLSEADVIKLMRSKMKHSSFLMWRERITGRKTKHRAMIDEIIIRYKCSRQKLISSNKVSKR